MLAFTPAISAACPLPSEIPMDVDTARQLCAAPPLCWRCQKPGHFAWHCLLGLEVCYLFIVEQEELLLQLLAVKDAAGALLLDEPTPELTLEKIKNETAFSNALHSETEEPQHPPSDVQTLTLEPQLSSLTPLKICWHSPAWVHQMPQQYVMASALSTNSLCLDVEIETTDTQQTHGVTALLDSGATGLFLDLEMPKKAGAINSVVDLVLHYWNHAEHAIFAITSLGRQDMILGFTWLQEHNPKVNWTKGEVTMSRCPWKCSTCAAEDRKECWTQVQKHAAIHACHASPLPFADLDLLDPPPLAFSCREALYKDNQSNSRALEEEHGGEFGGICKLELPDEVVEVGDQIYATTIHPLPSVVEIQASQTTSQWLVQAFAANAASQEF
ncbi:hypothetical protein E4T56_gene7122 [Termitomyces sp. T112]|nr:hypothetical protein E4T56_gene7122 [Termitomyces sp. T112]